eukprot:EG_transcript_28932
MLLDADDVVWVFMRKREDVDGAGDFGLYQCTLKSQLPEGRWRTTFPGGCADDGHSRPEEEPIEPQRIMRLTRPEQWAVRLGEVVLAWKVVNDAVGAWWVARVVGFEWKGLYKGEEDHVCVVQWLKAESWERDPAAWDKVRPACLLPLPDGMRPFVTDFLEAV